MRSISQGLALTLLLLAAQARASDLMGPESCRTCHLEAYTAWNASKHARAADALAADQRQSPLCLQCHSRDEIRSGAAFVTGVSCETCHGGGRYYQPDIVMRDRELARSFGLAELSKPETAAALCLSCHGGDVPSAQPFDLKSALEKIDHWSASRAARKAKLVPGASRLAPAPRQARAATTETPRALVTRWIRGQS